MTAGLPKERRWCTRAGLGRRRRGHLRSTLVLAFASVACGGLSAVDSPDAAPLPGEGGSSQGGTGSGADALPLGPFCEAYAGARCEPITACCEESDQPVEFAACLQTELDLCHAQFANAHDDPPLVEACIQAQATLVDCSYLPRDLAACAELAQRGAIDRQPGDRCSSSWDCAQVSDQATVCVEGICVRTRYLEQGDACEDAVARCEPDLLCEREQAGLGYRCERPLPLGSYCGELGPAWCESQNCDPDAKVCVEASVALECQWYAP